MISGSAAGAGGASSRTIGEPGTFQSMTRGAVSEAWAWTFHPAWYRELTGRDPREAYEKAREQAGRTGNRTTP